MISPSQVYKQISDLTSALIDSGLCQNQTFPSIKDVDGHTLIGTSNMSHSSFLKSIPYSEMYTQARSNRYFNMQMIDGALISLSYDFERTVLLRHTLTFFPAPSLDIFQNNPDVYWEDEIYADIVDVRIFPTPIRFDYDNREGVFVPIEHPVSHLTLGQYECCRIPVSSALTPQQFISFIVRHFYSTKDKDYHSALKPYKEAFGGSIFPEETKVVHMVIA